MYCAEAVPWFGSVKHAWNTLSFVITSVADIKWGRKIVLRIEGDNYCREDELMSRMRELIPSWKLPKEIEWVKALPRTANGKLKR